MKVVFVTNFWNHYQASFGRAFAELMGPDNFRMILGERLDAERKQLGWQEHIPGVDWVIGPPKSPKELEEYAAIVDDADVAIMGQSRGWMQRRRARTGKLTFVAMERMWKMPLYRWRFLNPRFLLGVQRFRMLANLPNVHYLAIGYYAADDVRAIRAFGDRIWNWGYFAEVLGEVPKRPSSRPLRILWAGRMLGWKKVDVLIEACSVLAKDTEFHLDIVGAGDERHRLGLLVKERNLGTFVTFHGPLPPDEVRSLMRSSDVYVLASDRNEGWGVVANEAIAEGSVLVANEEAGASRVLIEHGQTGFLYRNHGVNRLAGILRMLARDRVLCDRVRHLAWLKHREIWSPAVAVRKFVELSEALLSRGSVPANTDGPCSKCPEILGPPCM